MCKPRDKLVCAAYTEISNVPWPGICLARLLQQLEQPDAEELGVYEVARSGPGRDRLELLGTRNHLAPPTCPNQDLKWTGPLPP